ncbi:DUF1488 domain-containing protein [Paraburkholderia tropica]|uniref:DUF1488 domain-containing protein n=1 Tax=Paraburkholderia tropica TaxID=92647 RepID=UPI0007ED0F36|nr:DUF1488 domain-containing protein [Paraburkholderia tropica]OBR49201.1 hypothetical protein A6456_36085 [Paraburkholderia tropica]
MIVSFPNEVSPRVVHKTLCFRVVVDGRDVTCEISFEALEDHFGANPRRRQSVIEAFTAHRAAIERVVTRNIPHRLSGTRCQLFSRDLVGASTRHP